MSIKRIGLIRVLTTSNPETLNLHGKMIEQSYPGLSVVSRCIVGHPQGVHDEGTERTAAPLVVDLALQYEREGCDAVVVSCAGDPGVGAARRQLRIPVIGAGRATAALAAGTGDRVGVLGITRSAPEPLRLILGAALVAYARPEGVRTTLDLLTREGMEAVEQSALELKTRGAEVIALACTGLSTIRAWERIGSVTGLRVIDPVMAEGLFALYVASA